MRISKNCLRCKLVIDNTTIDQVVSFVFLGCKITNSEFPKEEVRKHIIKTSMVAGPLKQPIRSNKYLSVSCKSRIYKTCVRQIMIYDGEIQAETTTSYMNYQNEGPLSDNGIFTKERIKRRHGEMDEEVETK